MFTTCMAQLIIWVIHGNSKLFCSKHVTASAYEEQFIPNRVYTHVANTLDVEMRL